MVRTAAGTAAVGINNGLAGGVRPSTGSVGITSLMAGARRNVPR
jgi:hypothetical protein